MEKTFEMKKIVIMGATSGIGLRMAERLALEYSRRVMAAYSQCPVGKIAHTHLNPHSLTTTERGEH